MTQPNLVLCELADPGIDGIESYSPYCLKVHRALRAAGLAYKRRHGARPDAFKDLNPTGQVPVLLIDDEPVADSTRILHRIEAISGGALSRELSLRDRGEAWLWEEMADNVLGGFLQCARWADERNWPLTRETFFGKAPWAVRALVVPHVRARMIGGAIARDMRRAGPDACWERFLMMLNALEARAPERGFWMGRCLSVADMALFGQLQSFRTILTQTQRDQIELRERLTAYLDRVDRATREVNIVLREAAA